MARTRAATGTTNTSKKPKRDSDDAEKGQEKKKARTSTRSKKKDDDDAEKEDDIKDDDDDEKKDKEEDDDDDKKKDKEEDDEDDKKKDDKTDDDDNDKKQDEETDDDDDDAKKDEESDDSKPEEDYYNTDFWTYSAFRAEVKDRRRNHPIEIKFPKGCDRMEVYRQALVKDDKEYPPDADPRPDFVGMTMHELQAERRRLENEQGGPVWGRIIVHGRRKRDLIRALRAHVGE